MKTDVKEAIHLKDIVASRLLERMEACGISQSRLSLRANLGRSAVTDIVKGRVKSPKFSTLQSLASVLGCTVNYLSGLEELPHPTTESESDTTDQVGNLSSGEVIVPHQGYISLALNQKDNRIHFAQSWFDLEESTITVVGRDNLDALITALVDVREKLS